MHISDVSKCVKSDGGFDIKKNQAKSVTLNRDKVGTFIQMTAELPAMMDRMLTVSSRHDASDTDSDSSETALKKKRKKQPRKKVHFLSDGSDSETEKPTQSKSKISTPKKQLKKKRTHPYRQAYNEKKKQKKPRKDFDSNDTDLSE